MNKMTIRTPQDILNLPNYVESVDPKVRNLKRISSHYYLNEEIHCGLKNCRQPHKDGFLVELEDGYLTNVGHICGNQFGETFAAEYKRYADQELRPKAIRNIQEAIAKINSLGWKLQDLRTDANRISEYKNGLRSSFPAIYQDLSRRANNNNDRVSEQIERTGKEIDDLHALNPGVTRASLRYRDEPRGVIPGLWVLPINIREQVVTGLVGRAEDLLVCNIAGLPTDKLLDWERWSVNFDDAFKRAGEIIAAGHALFRAESFQLMAYLTTGQREKAALALLTAADLQGGVDAKAADRDQSSISKKEQDGRKKLAAIKQNAGRRNR